MYNVLLNREIFQVTKAYQIQFLGVPADPNESASVPAGTVEFIQGLLASAEDDWSQEETEFKRCYREQSRLEARVCAAITRVTAAAETLNRCNYIITYRSDWADRHELKAMRKPFVEQVCRLVKLVRSMTDALQIETLAKEVKNAALHPDLRGDDFLLLCVRKLRMSYAEHLANVCVSIHEMYQAALPAELNIFKLRSVIYRNMQPLVVALARADEQHQKDVFKLFNGQPTAALMAAVSSLVDAEPDDLLRQIGQAVITAGEDPTPLDA